MKRIQHKRLKEIDERMFPVLFHLQSLILERAAIDPGDTSAYIQHVTTMWLDGIARKVAVQKEGKE